MIRNRIVCALAIVCLIAGSTVVAPARADLAAQSGDKADKPKENKDGDDKKDKKDKKKDDQKADKADAGTGRPVLWEEPSDIESRDLFNGPGGADGAPNPNGKFTFVSRSKKGTSEKINVVDDKGRKWQVKFGSEARPAPAASRIVWAVGYHVDIDYFVKKTHIEGRGGFDVWDVRFKADDDFKEVGLWSWHANPLNAREVQGLKTLMALLNNWDLKEDNNKIARAKKKSGGDRSELVYYVSDLGATLGHTSSVIRKIPGFWSAPAGSKGSPGGYSDQVFIDGVRNGEVVFNYHGKDHNALEGVKVENARWIGDLLGRLSDKQLGDAFRAGGFADWEVTTYVRTVRARINELKNLK